MQASEREGIDKLEQDGGDLYFGFRGAGESRWALRKISKASGEPQTIAKTFSLKQSVIDEQNIYFFDEDGLSADVLCRASKMAARSQSLIPLRQRRDDAEQEQRFCC